MTTIELVHVKPAREELGRLTKGLDPESVSAIRAAFDGMFDQAEIWVARAATLSVTREDQVHQMRQARALRLEIKDARVAADKRRKALKEESLRRGQAIDAGFKILETLARPLEAHLLEQEEFAERAAAKRRDELRTARAVELRALGADPATYADLGAMPDEAWTAVIDSARAARDAREAKALADRQAAEAAATATREAEERRRAEEAERERLRAEENARLRRQAEEARQKAAQERAEREKAEAKARADAEAAEMVLRAERERAARVEAELAAENAEKERLAREQREAKPVEAAPAHPANGAHGSVDAARDALFIARAAYQEWQPEGDDETFVHWVRDELEMP